MMKKLLVILAASAAMLASAHAAEMEGTVKAIDVDAKTITLEDDTIVTVADDVDLEGITEGTKIKVTTGDGDVATSVEVVE